MQMTSDHQLVTGQANDINTLLEYYLGEVDSDVSEKEVLDAWRRLAEAAHDKLGTGWSMRHVEKHFEPKQEDPEAIYDREMECCEACAAAGDECLTHREVGAYHDEVFQKPRPRDADLREGSGAAGCAAERLGSDQHRAGGVGMSRVAMLRDLVDDQFCAADNQDPRRREQALWQLEAAFKVLLDAVDGAACEDANVAIVHPRQLTERMLHALGGGS